MKNELKGQILFPIIHLVFLERLQVYTDLNENKYLRNERTTKKIKRTKSNNILKRYCKNLSSILLISLFSDVGKLLEFFEISF